MKSSKERRLDAHILISSDEDASAILPAVLWMHDSS